MELKIKRLTETAILPMKAHPTDSGFDLFADEDAIIEPGEARVIRTGIAIALPTGHEAQIRPKSGVTSKTKLRVQLGTVDEPYRGEIGVIVDNINQREYKIDRATNGHITGLAPRFADFCRNIAEKGEAHDIDGDKPLGSYVVRKGDKIAQMVIVPIAHPKVIEVNELDATDRGEKGFGSTGVTAP